MAYLVVRKGLGRHDDWLWWCKARGCWEEKRLKEMSLKARAGQGGWRGERVEGRQELFGAAAGWYYVITVEGTVWKARRQ